MKETAFLSSSVSLIFTVIWFQSDPLRESAFRDYRGENDDEDNVAGHLDSIGKWIVRFSQLSQEHRLYAHAGATVLRGTQIQYSVTQIQYHEFVQTFSSRKDNPTQRCVKLRCILQI
jgi:hypothetical protein